MFDFASHPTKDKDSLALRTANTAGSTRYRGV